MKVWRIQAKMTRTSSNCVEYGVPGIFRVIFARQTIPSMPIHIIDETPEFDPLFPAGSRGSPGRKRIRAVRFSPRHMTEQLKMEIQGERVTNYLRAFLVVLFSFGTAFAYMGGTLRGVVAFFVVGIVLYAVATIVSLLVLRAGKYTSALKYYLLILEMGGLFLVQVSFLTLDDPDQWTGSVANHSRHSIYFLFIAAALVRFSPRFTLLTGISTALIYNLMYVLLAIRPEISVQGVVLPGVTRTVSMVQWVLGTVFLLAMSLVLVRATQWIRSIVTRAQNSEADAQSHIMNLVELMAEANSTVHSVGNSAKGIQEVSIKNDGLSQEQLSAIQETSATMEEMGASIDTIAIQAREQDELCQRNSSSMERLGGIIRRFQGISGEVDQSSRETLTTARSSEGELSAAIEGIQRIQESGAKIQEIVTVINDIADRTNLLALNAAIEAARAGEEGRGFSVVADEVGKLAEMSSSNARQIERLIESNRVDIEQGVTSIDTTVQALQGIIAKIKDMVGKIALMNELTMEQNKTSDAVFDDTEKIQNMSREMRNATSELVAGSNEVQNAMDSINTSAENFTRSSVELRESADELQTAVKRMEQKITEDQQKMMGM